MRICAMQRFCKASGGLYMHETVMTLKLNYSRPGRAKKKTPNNKSRTRFRKSDILEVLSVHISG